MLKLTGAVLLVACSVCMQGGPNNPPCALGMVVFGLLGLGFLTYGLATERQKT
jgi:hypothetical protein